MKNVVMGAMMSIIIALITIIILTTDDRIVRINEDNTALANALDESISIIDTDKYSISDTSQLIADITQGLLMQIESDSDITINVMDADRDKGIVTIEAVQDFIKPTGKSGQVILPVVSSYKFSTDVVLSSFNIFLIYTLSGCSFNALSVT